MHVSSHCSKPQNRLKRWLGITVWKDKYPEASGDYTLLVPPCRKHINFQSNRDPFLPAIKYHRMLPKVKVQVTAYDKTDNVRFVTTMVVPQTDRQLRQWKGTIIVFQFTWNQVNKSKIILHQVAVINKKWLHPIILLRLSCVCPTAPIIGH